MLIESVLFLHRINENDELLHTKWRGRKCGVVIIYKITIYFMLRHELLFNEIFLSYFLIIFVKSVLVIFISVLRRPYSTYIPRLCGGKCFSSI